MNALKLVNNQAVHYKQQHYDEASRPEYKIHFGTFFYSCKTSSSKTEDDTNT
jgi:hypothetical protein